MSSRPYHHHPHHHHHRLHQHRHHPHHHHFTIFITITTISSPLPSSSLSPPRLCSPPRWVTLHSPGARSFAKLFPGGLHTWNPHLGPEEPPSSPCLETRKLRTASSGQGAYRSAGATRVEAGAQSLSLKSPGWACIPSGAPARAPPPSWLYLSRLPAPGMETWAQDQPQK